MSFIKSIVVLGKHPNHQRDVRVYVVDKSYTGSGDLSELDVDYLNEIIIRLEKLIAEKNPSEYFEFGVDLFSVQSNYQTSKCKNDIEAIELEEVSTISLLLFIKELEKVKRKYCDLNNLKNIIGNAFEIIKNKPAEFKKWDYGEYYETQINDMSITLNLSEVDFGLSASEYLNDIQKLD